MTKLKNNRGASRKPRRGDKESSAIAWRFIFTSFTAIAMLLFVAWGIVRLEPLNIIQEYTNKPIASVSVEGDFQYVSQQHIENLVAGKLTETFLELDIVALKSHLELHPWIDRAVVARQWPDTLLIKITEQQPIARWNTEGFLNLRGEIVNLSYQTELNHLPLLKADDHYAKRVMQQYVLITKLLSEFQFAPLVLELDNTLSWSLKISPDITIKLGRDNIVAKLQRLMQVMTASLSDQIDRIETIDMRYKQGFAIGWYTVAEDIDNHINIKSEQG